MTSVEEEISDIFGDSDEEEGDSFVNEDDDIELSSVVKSLAGSNEPPTAPLVEEKKINDEPEITIDDLIKVSAASKSEQRKASKAQNPVASLRLDPPAPEPTRIRVERSAAYNKTKGVLKKWIPLIQANRQAKVRNFPELQDTSVAERVSLAALASSHSDEAMKRGNDGDLETQVASVLKSAGIINEKDIADKEDGNMFELLDGVDENAEESKEEVAERARLRALMFRHESKLKKWKKIKSKMFRKHHRKKTPRLSLEELAAIDPDLAKKEIERMEMKRAKERMSLRHQNMGWAKQVMKRDKNARLQVQRDGAEMSERHRTLVQRIETFTGRESDSEEEVAESLMHPRNEDDSDDERHADGFIKDAEESLDEEVQLKKKGIMGLPFMQRGIERRKAAARELLEDMKLVSDDARRRRLASDDEEEKEEKDVDDSIGGKLSFGGKKETKFFSKTETKPDVEYMGNSFVVQRSSGVRVGMQTSSRVGEITGEMVSVGKDEPLEDVSEEVIDFRPSRVNEKKKDVTEVKEDDTLREKDGVVGDGMYEDEKRKRTFEEDENPWLAPVIGRKRHRVMPGRVQIDVNELKVEDEEESVGIISGEQRDIVKRVFGAEDMKKEFEQVKKDDVMDGVDIPEDETLPGWGSWVGNGVKKSRREVMAAKKARKEAKAVVEEARMRRRDAKLKNVIIRETRERNVAKYTVPSLPHPYVSVSEYESERSHPVGFEWNPSASYAKNTQPEVMTKAGIAIAPLKYRKVSSGKKKRIRKN